VGRNELGVLQVARAYVQAQREYARLQASVGRGREYAQHFHSHAGMRDGLYWPIAAGERDRSAGRAGTGGRLCQ
jgi:hypothetical protein